MIRLETVLGTWKSIRADAAQAVEELPEGDLAFRPLPELMTFGEIARHILGAGHALSGLLLEGVENFQVPEFRQMLERHVFPLPETSNAAELAAAMRKSLEQRLAELARQSPEFFAGIVTKWDGAKLTRLEMVQFLKEHELTHRSQLFTYLRFKGVTPITTRRRQAKQ
jgi:uncharacterized damage-inducible protein DinB